MNKLLVLMLSFFSIVNVSFAQDTIVTTEGECIVARGFKKAENGECYYQNKKDNEKEIDLDDIFSIRNSTGKETILYKQDTTKGFYDSQDEMKQYIEGILMAKKTYKAPGYTYGGIGLAVGTVAITTTTIVSALFLSPIVPVAYCGYVIQSKPNVETFKVKIPENLRTDKYVSGYMTQVKKRRVTNAIMGSIGGLIASWAFAFMLM